MPIASLVTVLLLLSQSAGPDACTVFVRGERVRVPVPEMVMATDSEWRVLDDRLTLVYAGTRAADQAWIDAGALPVGWYRIEFGSSLGASPFTTAAVIAPQAAPPPEDTPIALDVALSWVPEADPAVWERCARLARLAGVAMVRDRLRWRDVQPEPGPLRADSHYEHTAAIQNKQGLQVLQVFHDTPAWAWADTGHRGRIPADLRHTWRFCRDIASHFRDSVHAWQPWNEGNSSNFGGHTIDELSAHQKAAFLGFRAGNPDAIVSWAPLGGINSEGLCQGIIANGVSPYFDVYALHVYDWPHDYVRLRRHALAAAAGKPLWVTECDRGLAADPESAHGDLTHEHEQRKAEFIVQSIASSLAAGAVRHFHFILPQYMEQKNTIQFGLLRHDHGPRMGYVALAATGRLLAGARYLGRLHDAGQPDVHVYAFRARPDGAVRDVLAAWAEAPVDWADRGRGAAPLALPEDMHVEGVWDYLGRPVDTTTPLVLTGAPVFIVLAEGETDTLALEAAPSAECPVETVPSPVVMQLRAPDLPVRGRIRDWAHEHDRMLQPGDHDLSVYVYNFGDGRASGQVRVVNLPLGWQCEPAAWEVALDPMERAEQPLQLHIPAAHPLPDEGAWLGLEGDFNRDGQPRLTARLLPDTGAGLAAE